LGLAATVVVVMVSGGQLTGMQVLLRVTVVVRETDEPL
jgi:hypothetical protein